MSELEGLFDRALGAYLGFAIGDALGATVEFLRPREIQALYGVHREIIGGGWLALERGQVTDDTTLSLALGDALLAAGADGLRGHAAGDQALLAGIGAAFAAWLRARPVDCGATCRRGIQRFMVDGSLAAPPNEGDAGNGALMRNLPVLLATLDDEAGFERLSLAQARFTHQHRLSDAAVLGLGRFTRSLLRGAGAAEVGREIEDWVGSHPQFSHRPYRGHATAYVVDTVQTVLHFFSSHGDFEDALVATVNQGDDADTTGALVGMLAGARCGAQALPGRWLARLQRPTLRAVTEQVSGLLALAAEAETLDG